MVTLRGAFAQVPSDIGVDPGIPRRDVLDVFSFVQNTYAERVKSIDDLHKMMIDLAKDFDLADVEAELQKVYVTPTTFPTAPSFAKLVLNSRWPKSVPNKPQLQNYGSLDFDYIDPIPPKLMEESFSWSGEPYSSEMRLVLIASIINDIANGTSLTPAVHAALLDREQNRRKINQASALRDAVHAGGANGCRLPDGQMAAIIAEVFKNQDKLDQDALNLVTEQDYSTAQRNKEFVHTLGVELEKVMLGEWDSWEARSLESAKVEFEFAFRAVDQAIQVYLAKWQGIEIQASAFKARIEAITSKNKGLNDQYIAEWDGYRANVDAAGAENIAKVQIRGLEIDTWKAEISAAATEQQSKLAEANFEFQQLLAKIEVDLKVAGINIEGFKAEADLREKILETLGQQVSQLIASIIGAMNASASESFGSSESQSHSLSDSASIGESYSTTGL